MPGIARFHLVTDGIQLVRKLIQNFANLVWIEDFSFNLITLSLQSCYIVPAFFKLFTHHLFSLFWRIFAEINESLSQFILATLLGFYGRIDAKFLRSQLVMANVYIIR
ncbi:hypothetical protein IKF43_01100 [Candidatus Saccharibacteria bacterium]|nr:hypothetical protein [Candidatus Saccharibacteria bacterium]